ncbi:MAG: DNA repair protein RecO [Bacteroidota bacterium]
MIVSTDAIVLRSMKYGETSKIVTLYSQKFGKITVIAKGARSAKSRFGASLEPMTYSSAILYKKEERDLHLLSKCEIAKPYLKFGGNGDKLATGLALVELVNMVMHDEEENLPMFALLVESLEAVDLASKNVMNIFFAFQLRLLEIFGYGLNLHNCSRCGRDILDDRYVEPVFLHLADGSVMCSDCHSSSNAGGIKMPREMVRSLFRLQSLPIASIDEVKLAPALRDEILAVLYTYLKYHIAGVRTLKSLSLFTNV